MLPELQKQFMDGLLRNETNIQKQLDTRICDAQQQLSIYRKSYQGGLLKAMKDIYPVTNKLLGDEFFDAMCLRYIKKTPCQSFDINKYGESFANFADQFKPVDEFVYLPDVIRLEWSWHDAYQAPDIPPQDFTPLLNFSGTQLASLYLNLQPSMSLLDSFYPVDLIWSANQNKSNEAFEHGDSINLEAEPRYLVVWRNGVNSHIDSVDSSFFEFLSLIQESLILGAIQENDSNCEEHLATSLQRGYFSHYHF